MERDDSNAAAETGVEASSEKPLSDFALFVIVTLFLAVLGFLIWITFICEDCYKSIIEPLLG